MIAATCAACGQPFQRWLEGGSFTHCGECYEPTPEELAERPPLQTTLGPQGPEIVAPPPPDADNPFVVTPEPTGSHVKLYRVELSEREMQCISNGLAAFFNVVRLQKMMVNPLQTEALLTSLGKFKAAIAAGEIKVQTGPINFEGLTK